MGKHNYPGFDLLLKVVLTSATDGGVESTLVSLAMELMWLTLNAHPGVHPLSGDAPLVLAANPLTDHRVPPSLRPSRRQGSAIMHDTVIDTHLAQVHDCCLK